MKVDSTEAYLEFENCNWIPLRWKHPETLPRKWNFKAFPGNVFTFSLIIKILFFLSESLKLGYSSKTASLFYHKIVVESDLDENFLRNRRKEIYIFPSFPSCGFIFSRYKTRPPRFSSFWIFLSFHCSATALNSKCYNLDIYKRFLEKIASSKTFKNKEGDFSFSEWNGIKYHPIWFTKVNS